MTAAPSLLVPIDPQAPSDEAMAIAGQIAHSLGAEVFALQVLDAPCPLPRLASLYQLTAPIRAQEVPVRLRVRQGDPVALILEEAQARHWSWIVMGAGRKVGQLGPVASAVLGRVSTPVAFVSPLQGSQLELTFSDARAAQELIGQMRAEQATWIRQGPRAVRAALPEGIIRSAI